MLHQIIGAPYIYKYTQYIQIIPGRVAQFLLNLTSCSTKVWNPKLKSSMRLRKILGGENFSERLSQMENNIFHILTIYNDV